MRNAPLVAAALLLAALCASALELRVVEGEAVGLRNPFDLAPLDDDTAAILEDLDGVVRVIRGSSRTVLGGLTAPRALAVDETGLLLVLDGPSGLVGFRRGKEAWRVKLGGEVKPPARTVGMAARNGLVWLVDRASPRVALFAFDGQGLRSVDLKARARSPFGVALGAAGEVFVTDPLGPAVLALSPSGTFQATFRLGGTGVTRPTGVTVDGSGRVWVSDGVTGTVTCFSAKGDMLAVRYAGRRLRFQDPLRLGSSRGFLWILEGRPGRLRRAQWEEP